MNDLDDLIAEAREEESIQDKLGDGFSEGSEERAFYYEHRDRYKRLTDALVFVRAERDADLARIAEAAELHQPEVIGVHEGQGAEVWCPHCETYWPCQTAVALGLNEGGNDD